MLLLYKAIYIHENGNVIVICMFIAVLNTAHSLHVSGPVRSGLLTQDTVSQVIVLKIQDKLQTFAVVLLLLLLLSEFSVCIL
jgi:hypothetical protein